MAEIKDIFQSAAELSGIVYYYGTPEQITAQFAMLSKGVNKRFVGLAHFMQSPSGSDHYYKQYSNYTVLFFNEVKEIQLTSKTEPIFTDLDANIDTFIQSLCRTSGISGIYPNQFQHTRTRKFNTISGTKCAAIEVVFENLYIKKC